MDLLTGIKSGRLRSTLRPPLYSIVKSSKTTPLTIRVVTILLSTGIIENTCNRKWKYKQL